MKTKLPEHLFVSDCDGNLYDTRLKDWSKLPPLRKNYSFTHGKINSLSDVKATIRNGQYTFPGCYPLYFITQDSAALCFKCAEKGFRQVAWDFQNKASTGWRIVACDVNYEDSSLYCDHCSKLIESAYGEKGAE